MQNEKSVEQIIGKRIQRIRRAKGYTQQQFAEMIGLSTKYLSIVKRKSKYSVVYTYTDDKGDKRQKWETFATNAEAKRRKAEVEFQQESGTLVIPEAKTVKELLEDYPFCLRVQSYIGELIFNMLVLVGFVKMSDHIIREMMESYLKLRCIYT